MAPSAAFNQAADAVLNNYKDATPDDIKLQFYGLFKQAKQSPPIGETQRPRAIYFRERYKWDAWKKVDDDGVTPVQAEKKYIELYNATKAEWFDPSKVKK